MKTAIATLAALAIAAGIQAQALPVTYTYIGDFFTGNQFGPGSVDPIPAGFTLQDRFIGSVTINNGQVFGSFTVGPYALGGIGIFETDSLGAVIRWSLFDAIPGLDIITGGFADGSGEDIIFGDRWSEGTIHGGAFVNYPAGSPSRWTIVPASVPDSGTTLGFLILALCAVVAAGGQCTNTAPTTPKVAFARAGHLEQ